MEDILSKGMFAQMRKKAIEKEKEIGIRIGEKNLISDLLKHFSIKELSEMLKLSENEILDKINYN